MKSIKIKVTILGSGTSTGVPVIACQCEVCKSTHPYNQRTRSSIMITELDTGMNLIIDTTPDFRTQVLRHDVRHLDYVLFTHTHADHCHGLDDLRAFYFSHKKPVECWIAPRHVEELRSRFSYVFHETGYLGTKPQIILKELPERHFSIRNLDIETFELPHGNGFSSAFRFGSFAYATDFKGLPEAIKKEWKGKVKVFIASGIGFKEHPTHNSVPETVQIFKDLGVSKGIITHLSHGIDYERDKVKLPSHVEYAYDGMELFLDI